MMVHDLTAAELWEHIMQNAAMIYDIGSIMRLKKLANGPKSYYGLKAKLTKRCVRWGALYRLCRDERCGTSDMNIKIIERAHHSLHSFTEQTLNHLIHRKSFLDIPSIKLSRRFSSFLSAVVFCSCWSEDFAYVFKVENESWKVAQKFAVTWHRRPSRTSRPWPPGSAWVVKCPRISWQARPRPIWTCQEPRPASWVLIPSTQDPICFESRGYIDTQCRLC